MCNLNIIVKNTMLPRLASFMMAVTSSSFAHNSDADGVYCDKSDFLFKRTQKLDLYGLRRMYRDGNVIIAHQRIATSGFSSKYAQPFYREGFALAHNGVINHFLRKEGSDTWGFFERFLSDFAMQGQGSRRERIVATLNNLLDLQAGSFSIALYDAKDRKLYYVKNDQTDIHCYRGNKFLFLTTSRHNDAFLPMIAKEFDEETINDFSIYCIDPEGLTLEVVGMLQRRYPTIPGLISSRLGDNPTPRFYELDDEIPCSICSESTPNLEASNGVPVCDECIQQGLASELEEEGVTERTPADQDSTQNNPYEQSLG